MLFNFHKNHKELLITITVMYAILAIFVSIVPAFKVEESNGPLPKDNGLTAQERRGLAVYIANGCVACHTQQVRNIEMDQMWGSRPSIPADYYYSKQRMSVLQQSPSLLGSERTGPDLTSVGQRLPAAAWQYTHLFNPRAVVPQSIMPAFPWLFEIKKNVDSSKAVIVNLPEEFQKKIKGTVVATQEAQDLVAYLLSLKQVEIPTPADFLPDPKALDRTKAAVGSSAAGGSGTSAAGAGGETALPDGKALFNANCAVCHQTNGEGVKGAFPSLAGNDIVNDDDASLHIKIVLQGYDASTQYSVMPPFGNRLSDAEIAAIINYERTNWGNEGKTVTAEDVTKARAESK